MKYFYCLLLSLVAQATFAQTLKLTPINGNKKLKTINEGNFIAIDYIPLLKETNKKTKIQGKLININDSVLIVKPFFSGNALIVSHKQILSIKKENLLFLYMGALATSAVTFVLLENVNQGSQANLFYTSLVGPTIFLLAWNNLINPMKRTDPYYFTRNNRWIISVEE